MSGARGRARVPPRHQRRRLPAQRRRNGVRAGFWRAEARDAGRREARQSFGGFRHQECGERLAGTGAVDDRLHGELGMEARRRADHRQDEIEFGRRQQDVERGLHHVVAGAGGGEVDETRRRDLDAGRVEPRERLGARPFDRDAAHGEAIDHHGGAATGCGHHADTRCALGCRHAARPAAWSRSGRRAYRPARCRRRRGTHSPHRPRRRARRCARPQARAPRPSGRACRRRSACRAPPPRAQRCAAHRPCAGFRETARSRRCRDRRRVAAQISPSDRSTSLPTDTRPANPTPRALPRDSQVPIRLPECDAAKIRPVGRSTSSKAALAVSIALWRRSTTPRLDGPTRRMPVRAQISRSAASRASPASPASAKPFARIVATRTPRAPQASTAATAPSVGVTI